LIVSGSKNNPQSPNWSREHGAIAQRRRRENCSRGNASLSLSLSRSWTISARVRATRNPSSNELRNYGCTWPCRGSGCIAFTSVSNATSTCHGTDRSSERERGRGAGGVRRDGKWGAFGETKCNWLHKGRREAPRVSASQNCLTRPICLCLSLSPPFRRVLSFPVSTVIRYTCSRLHERTRIA